uniref:Non-specific serine/threonine protein kinase n=1 Tax=Zooxanthella nutricula TaxID=1333877 RepID=A0A7S2LE61_9DINO|mmetsp:Transcript_60182/g.183813  ORF Transcript_60182/g.183813 Transcript_60182/m.183813 type:complete len:213 (+) Transcript_60182:2-640(+)
MECKRSTSVDQLCKGCAPVFASYLNYCRALRFEDRPDYAYLRRLFKYLFMKEAFVNDGMFDWSLPVSQAAAEQRKAGGAAAGAGQAAEGGAVATAYAPQERPAGAAEEAACRGSQDHEEPQEDALHRDLSQCSMAMNASDLILGGGEFSMDSLPVSCMAQPLGGAGAESPGAEGAASPPPDGRAPASPEQKEPELEARPEPKRGIFAAIFGC